MAYFGEEVKKLGFGMMRLPKLEDGSFDIEQIKQMVDRFLAAGFTYFDTAWAYAGSEVATRKALVERYPRDSYTLATKISPWRNIKDADEAKHQFDVSLEQTGAGYFDYYLLHNLGVPRTHFFDDFGIWDFVQEKKAAGLIKHVGFSFHGSPEELDSILTAHPEAEFVQLQINYADWDDLSIRSGACYKVARKHGKSVVIMEPVKGGLLANPPESVQKLFKAAEPDSSFASWAIRFSASLDGVITVLSGMSTLAQMENNISYMKDFTGLTDEQRKVLAEAQEAIKQIPIIPCTGCEYCGEVCPQNIGVPNIFAGMNFYIMYGDENAARVKINNAKAIFGRGLPADCLKCGLCEDACPQHLQIRSLLEEINAKFDM